MGNAPVVGHAVFIEFPQIGALQGLAHAARIVQHSHPLAYECQDAPGHRLVQLGQLFENGIFKRNSPSQDGAPHRPWSKSFNGLRVHVDQALLGQVQVFQVVDVLFDRFQPVGSLGAPRFVWEAKKPSCAGAGSGLQAIARIWTQCNSQEIHVSQDGGTGPQNPTKVRERSQNAICTEDAPRRFSSPISSSIEKPLRPLISTFSTEEKNSFNFFHVS